MDLQVPILTEKEAFAVRRWELLRELRIAGRVDWRGYLGFSASLLWAAWMCFWVSTQPVTWVSIFFMILAVAAGLFNTVNFIVAPLKRRIAALEKLLEDEVKRPR